VEFCVYPGALEREETKYKIPPYRSLLQREEIPQRGGVGEIPLTIRHQHRLPICTGEAGAYLESVLYYQKERKMLDFSGLFIYKMNRLYYDNFPSKIKGSTLRSTMQTLKNQGVCLEQSYVSNKETLKQKLSKKQCKYLLKEASNYRINQVLYCKDLDDILLALAGGNAVIFSMIIYTDFYHTQKGRVNKEISGEKIGGHSMVALNYDLCEEYIEVVQSWGKEKTGPTDGGYMYIPFARFCPNETILPLIEAYVAN